MSAQCIGGCGDAAVSRGMCRSHYSQWRHGKPLTELKRRRPRRDDVVQWLRSQLVDVDGCWVWTGVTDHGYGRVWADGRNHRVHRLMYERTVAPVPPGLELDHLCRNRACANPDHLEPVTHAENVRRAQATKDECPSGHPYDEANTYINPRGARECRACKNRSRP